MYIFCSLLNTLTRHAYISAFAFHSEAWIGLGLDQVLYLSVTDIYMSHDGGKTDFC